MRTKTRTCRKCGCCERLHAKGLCYFCYQRHWRWLRKDKITKYNRLYMRRRRTKKYGERVLSKSPYTVPLHGGTQ